MVTASTPLMVSEDGKDAVAAAVGLQMEYSKFHEFFVNSTRVCPREFATSHGTTAAAACNLTCASPVIVCSFASYDTSALYRFVPEENVSFKLKIRRPSCWQFFDVTSTFIEKRLK